MRTSCLPSLPDPSWGLPGLPEGMQGADEVRLLLHRSSWVPAPTQYGRCQRAPVKDSSPDPGPPNFWELYDDAAPTDASVRAALINERRPVVPLIRFGRGRNSEPLLRSPANLTTRCPGCQE